ncbi:MAG: CoB--CoM heterodisulfide reductase iron-sulfur subunit A family protein [Candidatus Tectomicrobia bacterium]|uniref:CoB--CoM heterodisulfide reductase iron-sulfur subunit A family protein n=1 Tax=Tectimicrobiota bacterium TaxID=2528274 RepID=A0A932CL50_UNCTE|nr:CoB--CoM heterodisulfide reductase iron-sulfur subunit A family protein [Candidatus Tectomicrobia bacterium]
MPSVLVIGGGVSGLQAAADLARLGCSVHLVEKEGSLGGRPVQAKFYRLIPDLRRASEVIDPLIESVVSQERISLSLSSRVTQVSESPEGFRSTIEGGSQGKTVMVEAILVTTGYEHFDPTLKQEYGYGIYPDVITTPQLEAMLHPEGPTGGEVRRPSNGEIPQRVALFQCVGSRDEQVGNRYCCKLGCITSTKQAIEIKERHPEAEVYIHYMDIRTVGLGWEELYWKAQEVYRIHYLRGRGAEILPRAGRLQIRAEDTLLNRPLQREVDLVVLAVGMRPGEGTRQAARLLDLPVGAYGFLSPADSLLRPLDLPRAGVFAAGAALGPKDIETCIAEGSAAAARAMAFLMGKE